MGVTEDDFVIIQVARLVPIKDHKTAVRAIHLVALREPKAKFVVVGEGPEESAIRAAVDEYGLGQRVRLLGLRGDVARLLRAADVFLLTSINEGIPLTV